MIKIKIDCDEWYPVYGLMDENTSYGKVFEIDEKLEKKLRKAFSDFNECQQILADLYEKR